MIMVVNSCCDNRSKVPRSKLQYSKDLEMQYSYFFIKLKYFSSLSSISILFKVKTHIKTSNYLTNFIASTIFLKVNKL